MKLVKLLMQAELEVACSDSEREIEISEIVCDSRKVEKGALFVALRGLRQDGCCYIDEVFRRGAAAVLCEREAERALCFRVPNARQALARLCSARYGHPSRELKIIGVTGTNGKTSVSAMLYWVLRQAGHNVGLIGTVSNLYNDKEIRLKNADELANMTTPDPTELYALLAQMRQDGAEYVVMEVTSHALTLEKTEPILFSRAVFTNLTAEHMDLHGDMEDYYTQKKKLFAACQLAIVSSFSGYGARLCRELEGELIEVSSKTVLDIENSKASGVAFSLLDEENGRIQRFTLPVPGGFSVENGALCAATARSLGIADAQIAKALASFPGVPGRMQRICENPLGITVILDYAHTPDALEKLLEAVRGFLSPQQRVMLLFGCGGDRDREKRRSMGSIASRLADFLVLTSDNARSEEPERILEEILRGVDKEKPFVVIKDRREAIAYAVNEVGRGDVLILAGKGHETYEIRGTERLPFCEKEIVTACMQARLKREGYADQAL